MTNPTDDSNVVWPNRWRRSASRESIADLEAELARERELLLRLRAGNSGVDVLERRLELTRAMLAIARA